MQTKNRGFFSWLLMGLIIFWAISFILDWFDKTIKTDYSSLVNCINGGLVQELYIDESTATAVVGEDTI